MNDNININDSDIKPELTFRNLCFMYMKQLINFPYIEKDFDAITDYQLLCLVVKHLNKVIDNNNKQNESITNLYNAFIQLQNYMNNSVQDLEDVFNTLNDYVRDYFANLDVQDEINNKLDQMLEDGILEQIIEQFINSTALWVYDTVADLKNSSNLINGSYARTLGYYNVNDGGGATYKITETESQTEYQEELESGLYATLIIEDYVTPEMFGAYGDGIHDDTLALSNCLNYKCLLDKTYLTTSPIVIQNKNIYIDGFGTIKSTSITRSEPSSEESILKFINCEIVLKNFSIIGSNSWLQRQRGLTTGTEYQALRDITPYSLRVQNCKGEILNLKTSYGLTGMCIKDCYNLLVKNCHVHHTMADGYETINASHDILFENCSCDNVDDDCYSINNYTNDVSNCGYNISYINCHSINVNYGRLFCFWGCHDIDAINCSCIGNGGLPIIFAGKNGIFTPYNINLNSCKTNLKDVFSETYTSPYYVLNLFQNLTNKIHDITFNNCEFNYDRTNYDAKLNLSYVTKCVFNNCKISNYNLILETSEDIIIKNSKLNIIDRLQVLNTYLKLLDNEIIYNKNVNNERPINISSGSHNCIIKNNVITNTSDSPLTPSISLYGSSINKNINTTLDSEFYTETAANLENPYSSKVLEGTYATNIVFRIGQLKKITDHIQIFDGTSFNNIY